MLQLMTKAALPVKAVLAIGATAISVGAMALTGGSLGARTAPSARQVSSSIQESAIVPASEVESPPVEGPAVPGDDRPILPEVSPPVATQAAVVQELVKPVAELIPSAPDPGSPAPQSPSLQRTCPPGAYGRLTCAPFAGERPPSLDNLFQPTLYRPNQFLAQMLGRPLTDAEDSGLKNPAIQEQIGEILYISLSGDEVALLTVERRRPVRVSRTMLGGVLPEYTDAHPRVVLSGTPDRDLAATLNQAGVHGFATPEWTVQRLMEQEKRVTFMFIDSGPEMEPLVALAEEIPGSIVTRSNHVVRQTLDAVRERAEQAIIVFDHGEQGIMTDTPIGLDELSAYEDVAAVSCNTFSVDIPYRTTGLLWTQPCARALRRTIEAEGLAGGEAKMGDILYRFSEYYGEEVSREERIGATVRIGVIGTGTAVVALIVYVAVGDGDDER